jgi:S1-C subfamily serine protease
VTPLDWIIIGFALLMGVWGYTQGLIVGALSFGGFLAGGFLGSRLGPELLEEGSRSPYAPLFALVGALLLGGLLAVVLEVVGLELRNRLPDALGFLDGIGGAALVACLGLFLAWLAGAVALQTPGARELRQPIQRSAILQQLNETLPPSGRVLQALARFDPFPEIRGPSPNVGPPPRAIARDREVRAAGASVVRILGTACGLGVQGSGWVAGNGLVVTNAHVVAGQDDTTVQTQDGARHDADAVVFDPRNDVAVLRSSEVAGVTGLDLNVDARSGTPAAILGYPGNGSFDAQPGRLGGTQVVRTQDAYGNGPVRRRITSIRGRVRHGNSGGPAVDGRGRVVTTIFAASVSDGGRSGFGVPDSIARAAVGHARDPVDTGPCAR